MKKNVIIVFLVLANLYSLRMWYVAQDQIQEARELADKNAIEAVRQSELARENAQLAEEQRRLAMENAELARLQMDEMSKQLAKLKAK